MNHWRILWIPELEYSVAISTIYRAPQTVQSSYNWFSLRAATLSPSKIERDFKCWLPVRITLCVEMQRSRCELFSLCMVFTSEVKQALCVHARPVLAGYRQIEAAMTIPADVSGLCSMKTDYIDFRKCVDDASRSDIIYSKSATKWNVQMVSYHTFSRETSQWALHPALSNNNTL